VASHVAELPVELEEVRRLLSFWVVPDKGHQNILGTPFWEMVTPVVQDYEKRALTIHDDGNGRGTDGGTAAPPGG